MSAQITELRRTWVKEAAVAQAGRRYLRVVRGAPADVYRDVEEAAWNRLVDDLERLGRPLRVDPDA